MTSVRTKGFTLMELLVVMAIIAILSGLVFFGVRAAQQSGNKRRAEAEVRELAKAWKWYWTVYRKWPGGVFGLQRMDLPTMRILQGADHDRNRLRIRFMEIDYGVVEAEQGFRDPWGNYYWVDFSDPPPDWSSEEYATTVFFQNGRRFLYEE